VDCKDRDRLILAFALALNAQNDAWARWEQARSEAEREQAKKSIQESKVTCHQLQAQLLGHCAEHGC
jgi:hypothetical protein